MLSCDCSDEWSGEGWCWFVPYDFTIYNKKRGKRCCSCKKIIIHKDDTCVEFTRMREPYTEIEEKISGEEIDIASLFMCERCGEIFLNLTEIGYCLDITGDSMETNLKKYWDLTGFNPQKYL